MTAFGKFAKTLAKVRGGGGGGRELAPTGCLHSPSVALLGKAAFVGPNASLEEGDAHKTGLAEAQATSDCRFARRWLSFDLREKLIAAAPLSLFISRAQPFCSGRSTVHVVKAVYEQWPDMKPRLLRPCKQPHLFGPTCSPVFTQPANNEINPADYCYSIWVVRRRGRRLNSKTEEGGEKKKKKSSDFKAAYSAHRRHRHHPGRANSFIPPLIHPYLSLFIYISPWVFVFIWVPWTLPPPESDTGAVSEDGEASWFRMITIINIHGGFTYHPWLEGHGSHYETSAGGAPWYILHRATMDLCIP